MPLFKIEVRNLLTEPHTEVGQIDAADNEAALKLAEERGLLVGYKLARAARTTTAMFDLSGHAIIVRGVRHDDRQELAGLGVDPSQVSMIVEGEDLARCILVVFDRLGQVSYRADEAFDPVILANYEAAARTINAAVERETVAALTAGSC